MIYNKYIRPHGRQLLIKAIPNPYINNKIAVVGLPRSGTSWLAKAVSMTEKTVYYFEPDHDYVYGGSCLYPYLDKLQNNGELERHIIKTFKGNVTSEYVIAEQDLKDILAAITARNLLVKWVHFPFCLDWIKTKFPDILFTQIIRHPVPLFLSWATKNWDPSYSLDTILNQENLIEGPLKEYKRVMISAKSPWEKAGAFWGSATYMQYHSQADKSLFRTHEWYCESPEERITWLIHRLGLVEKKSLHDFLSRNRKTKPGPGYGLPRNSIDEIKKWYGKIDKNDYRDLISIINQFDFPFYDYFDSTPYD